MKKTFFLVLALILSSNSVLADPDFADIRKISVTGKAQTKVKPNKATVNFAVISREDSPEEARKENAKTTKNVLNSLRRMKIKDSSILMNSLNISEKKEYDRKTKRYELVGYEARRSFTVEILNLKLLPEVISKVIKEGSNQLNSVNYGLRDPEIAKNDTLELALKNAKIKALRLVKSLDNSLGKVLLISESSISKPISVYPLHRSAMLMDSAKAESEPEAYSTGDLGIDASINVTFEII